MHISRDVVVAVEYLLVPDVSGDDDVRVISAALTLLPGVRLVTVSSIDKRVRVEHDGRASVEELLRAISAAGYQQVRLLV
jgi:copper chaperone CopZ